MAGVVGAHLGVFPPWSFPSCSLTGHTLGVALCLADAAFFETNEEKINKREITFFSVFLGSCENFKRLHSALPAKLTWTANAELPSPAWVPTATACFGESPMPASFHPPSVLLSSLPCFFPFLSFPPSSLLLFLSLSLSHSPSPHFYKKSMI